MSSSAELAAFVYQEARLLDSGRFDDWAALFADDGRYWVPLSPDQREEDRLSQSIADEDRLLLDIRVERIKNPRAYSLHPRVTCQHVMQQPLIEGADDRLKAYRLRTPFMYAETRGEDRLVLFGTAFHHLRGESGGLRIVLKRIDLLGADAPLPSIYLLI